MRENLLGILAGDFAYEIGEGAGIHFHCDKEKLLSAENKGSMTYETWQSRIKGVTFTDRDGKPIDAPSSETQTLFGIWDLELKSQDHPDFVRLSFTAAGGGMQFAHMSLVRLLNLSAQDNERLSWRRVARKEKLTTIADFRGAVETAIGEKVVHFILNHMPHTLPDFAERAV
jgi:hypothetical protein